MQRPSTHSAFAPRSHNERSGSVLIAVLAIIALLSFLITRFMEEASQDLEYRALFNEPPDARSFAFSLLEISLATLNEVALIDEGKLYAPEQGWADPIAYSNVVIPNGWTASIEITDATDKIPLNSIEEARLNRIFEETFEFDFGTSRELSSTLLDWIDADDTRRLNGYETEEYLDENPPYRAANAPLQTLEELRLLKVWQDEFFDDDGKPNELYTLLASIFTVAYQGEINANVASQDVIDSISLEDDWFQETLFEDIDDETPYLKSIPDSAAGKFVSSEARLLRITVTLNRGSVPLTLQALVEPQIDTESSSGGGNNLPGSASGADIPKSGSAEEQEALKIPFKIVRLTTEIDPEVSTQAARYSEFDFE